MPCNLCLPRGFMSRKCVLLELLTYRFLKKLPKVHTAFHCCLGIWIFSPVMGTRWGSSTGWTQCSWKSFPTSVILGFCLQQWNLLEKEEPHSVAITCAEYFFFLVCQFLLSIFGILHPLFWDLWFVLTGTYSKGNHLGLQRWNRWMTVSLHTHRWTSISIKLTWLFLWNRKRYDLIFFGAAKLPEIYADKHCVYL